MTFYLILRLFLETWACTKDFRKSKSAVNQEIARYTFSSPLYTTNFSPVIYIKILLTDKKFQVKMATGVYFKDQKPRKSKMLIQLF